MADLVIGSRTSASSTGSPRRAEEDNGDDLNEWLAAAKRMRPEALRPCPVSCTEAKNDTSGAGWSLFPDATRIKSCNETMLLSMVVQPPQSDEITTEPIIRACSADYSTGEKPLFVPDEQKASLCTTANRVLEDNHVQLYHGVEASNEDFSTSHLVSAGRQMIRHLAQQTPSCNNNAIEFAYSQSAAIGLFSGVELHQHGITADVLDNLLAYVEKQTISNTIIVQLCGAKDRGADYSIGIVATSAENLPFVHKSVSTWANGGCVNPDEASEDWMKVTLRIPGEVKSTSSNSTNATTSLQPISASAAPLGARSRLQIRADCKTTTVHAGDGCSAVAERCGIAQTKLKEYNRINICTTLVKDELVCCSTGTLPSTLPPGNSDGTCKLRTVISGDDCASLPSKCGISANDFLKANTKENLCSTLMEGQQVCCTAGKRPDLKPKPDANGNCATYLTQPNDSCTSIAIARDLDPKDLEEFNKNTWGWNGCDPTKFFRDFLMCVSSGTPPMPATVANAVCGPTMPGAVKPPSGSNMSSLNPCPLNVCCNIWGQCGTTDDYCTVKKSATGAPGTSGHQNGCISNCGRDIIKGPAPAKKMKVAYYEAWNFNRECLNMDVETIPDDYTHIHFAFANISAGTFKPEITDPLVKIQFDKFKQLQYVKKIISFGGWDFSTFPGTFSILREAVKPANRETFKNNIVAFVKEHNLDGVDLDWEYPGAPDIPDIPTDDPQNGLNYYRLLSSVKSSLGSSKSVSFAAPSSFWYLKSFPVKNMAKDLDYIVYMTYDLHGQWDYNNNWTSPGCENGNCLRSHVNETETKDALSMITKAGAVSNKVVVGVSSYGRSFKMQKAGCDSEMCRFTGTPRISNANKGRCTDTAGYISNAEIKEILQGGNVNKQWTKEGSNMFVYNDTEWVAYMDDDMKEKRASVYDSYNFAGTSDWAVDLQDWWDGSGGDYDEAVIDDHYWSECTGSYSTLEQLEDRKDSIPAHCMEQYIAEVQNIIMKDALDKYKKLLDDGYDDKFSTYESYTKEQIPEQIDKFMASDEVDKYFTCQEYKWLQCCNSCRYATCAIGCVGGDNCKSGYGSVNMDACPKYEFVPVSTISGGSIPNATFSLKDENGFYSAIAESWGIEKEWITFGKRLVKINNGCQWSNENVQNCIAWNNNFFFKYPLPADNSIKIYNPKDTIGDSYANATDLLERFSVMNFAAQYDDDLDQVDMTDAGSLPAFSVVEAVDSMEKIVKKADEIEKEERKEMILNFITGFLFWIPFVGEAAGATGMTAVRTISRLIGGVGDTAQTLYDVVKDPDNAFMAVFSYLAGAGVGRSGFKSAAESRRSIEKKDYDALGNVKVNLDKVESIRGLSCPA
ncbi:putative glycosyl hydrolase, family 18 [Bimuria novae-zelandiae CBS 107.79]|uniref:chitinase n=1 Tax=Bimuria novae-zelandiae CBS 107.79 TaxID=1447943 RepID=A0A6A5VIP7_9PLEO|nr:putative glycosyl hydrolase, family 18 [Bimuria novae-zelandiae CBS 107.79]